MRLGSGVFGAADVLEMEVCFWTPAPDLGFEWRILFRT